MFGFGVVRKAFERLAGEVNALAETVSSINAGVRSALFAEREALPPPPAVAENGKPQRKVAK